MKIPAYVSLIDKGIITIEGDIESIGDTLKGLGLSAHLNKNELPYLAEHDRPEKNNDLIHKLNVLNNLQVAFLFDPDQHYDPAYTIEYLKELGLVKNKFRTIVFTSKNTFEII